MDAFCFVFFGSCIAQSCFTAEPLVGVWDRKLVWLPTLSSFKQALGDFYPVEILGPVTWARVR